MRLSSLKLEYFRNYTTRKLNLSERTTLIVGNNGSGKTNILEAIRLLASGKSFRAQRVEEMIMFEEELSRVSGSVVLDRKTEEVDSITELEILLTRGELQGRRVAKRRYSVDGAPRRLIDFASRLAVVLFCPEDLQLILGSPTRRRGFLDEVLLQVDREYRRSLVSYEKALIRRNRLLDVIRDEGVPRTQLTFWNQLLVRHGMVVSQKRSEFLQFINSFKSGINSFKAHYDSSVISEKRLEKYIDREIAVGYTLVGPHKDDMVVKFESGKELALYGSRGEQRLAVLWLKLAELAFVFEKLGEKPVLLLDDIFSELDQEHRDKVFSIVPNQQTIITTTDLDLIKSKYRKKSELIRLS